MKKLFMQYVFPENDTSEDAGVTMSAIQKLIVISMWTGVFIGAFFGIAATLMLTN